MASSFAYSQPVKLVFGGGTSDNLSQILADCGLRRGVLIADKIFATNGLADKILCATPQIVSVFSDITPNPLLSEVERAAQQLKDVGTDFAVALGGGSAIDLAKFACSMVFAEHSIKDYFYKKQTFDSRRLPLIVLPTTAGTGSEVTSVSVCNDQDTGAKAPLSSDNFYPYMAIVDPWLTISVPPFVTATTGLDAMSHALEGFWSRKHQPICDMYAQESLKLIFANLEKAYNNGKDAYAREALSLGALYAGLAFGLPKTAAVHGCSYPISINYGLSHGEACAFTLDMFVQENATADPRIDALAKKIGFANSTEMADKIAELKQKFGLKATLKSLGVENVRELATECVRHPLFANNPKQYRADSLARDLVKYYG